jgi:hypothetical protein
MKNNIHIINQAFSQTLGESLDNLHCITLACEVAKYGMCTVSVCDVDTIFISVWQCMLSKQSGFLL